MRSFWNDIRFGLRLVRKAPGASLIAMIALGLGIGANTAIFSVANGVLLHPLPYAHLDRLLALSEVPPQAPPTATNSVSAFNYATWKQQARALGAMAAYRYDQVNLSGAGMPAMVQGAEVTANFFTLLPSTVLVGRTFMPGEDQPGHEHEVVLSQTLWQHQFGGQPGIVGQTIQLDQQPYTVVGILGQGAVMPQAAELWLPLALTPAELHDRKSHSVRIVAELAPGKTMAQAQAELAGIVARVDARYPETNHGWGAHVESLTQFAIGQETASYVLLLMGAVGFLLLIACANVANLQFARALGRSHELALRVALGASRWRLLRQLLAENVLLGLGGAVVGVGFAAVSIRMILVHMPADVAVFIGGWERIRLDGTALLFTLVIAVGAGIVAGLAPAWHAARPELNSTLKEGGRGAIGHSRKRLRSALVAFQIALALVLLVGAGLMVTGFQTLLDAGRQFQPASLLTAAINLPDTAQYKTPQARAVFYRQALERMAALPGVTGAATASDLPLGNGYNSSAFSIEGRPIANASQTRYVVQQSISPNFFALLHVPMIAGRTFSSSDGAQTQPVVIISQRLAEHYFPGRSPLGQHLKLGLDNAPNPWMTVVGVASNVKWDWSSPYAASTLYVPVAQHPQSSASFLLRGAGGGDITQLGPSLRRAVASVDASEPLFQIESLARFIHESSIGIAYVSVMLTVAGVLALILAAIGVYGVMAFLVSERLREFGIRRALGASPGALVVLVLRRGGAMLAWGLGLGLPLAYGLARALQGLIVGAGAGDIGTFAFICGLLAAMAVLACLLPARQATRVDPLVALREP